MPQLLLLAIYGNLDWVAGKMPTKRCVKYSRMPRIALRESLKDFFIVVN